MRLSVHTVLTFVSFKHLRLQKQNKNLSLCRFIEGQTKITLQIKMSKLMDTEHKKKL